MYRFHRLTGRKTNRKYISLDMNNNHGSFFHPNSTIRSDLTKKTVNPGRIEHPNGIQLSHFPSQRERAYMYIVM